ncbi:vacuolar protein sorting-associated protein 37D [Lagopus muta]|uniref:vacuolar protein sorting-associated protein 37D n=1 Tax=Lagopus leucura TaxID=30410 RepID=UPI001C686CBA|nr:vacuolar protein sorting-associated protein 37D [Lagopus leucura]XP_048822754.1 vacuolar protein sorting-associated protein 37D [Lagopus muta]
MARPPAPPGAPRCFGALSTGQLRALLQDEPRLQRAVRLSRKFQALQREREERLAANSALARDNLALRPRLEDGKAALAIKYQELREVREACRAKLRRLEAYLEECGPQRALDRLRAALDSSEAEAEAQMQRFLAHEVPLDAFLESFCRSRARSHVSRTQLEKLQELLQMGRDPAGETPGLNPAPDRGAASPKALELRCGFVPAVLVPAAAVVPFAVPPKHRLPALGQPPVAPHPAPHATPLSPRPFRRREPEPLQP